MDKNKNAAIEWVSMLLYAVLGGGFLIVLYLVIAVSNAWYQTTGYGIFFGLEVASPFIAGAVVIGPFLLAVIRYDKKRRISAERPPTRR